MKRNLLLTILLILLVNIIAKADNVEPTITAESNSTYCWDSPVLQATSVYIAENVSITDSDNDVITTISLQIAHGYVNGEDLLSYSGGGFTVDWSAIEGKLTLERAATNNYQLFIDAIESVVYSNSSSNSVGAKQFSISIGNANYLPSTLHYYEYISDAGISWTDAKIAAEALTYQGAPGYLATLTSQEEADFAGLQAVGVGWIGATDTDTEGDWRWVTGPEGDEDGGLGRLFWQGLGNGNAVNGEFNFWNSGEPNNVGSGGEDYCHITDISVGPLGSWNDLPLGGGANEYAAQGYVVEYGMPGFSFPNVTAVTELGINPKVTSLAVASSVVCPGANAEYSIAGTPDATLTYNINGGADQAVVLDGTGNAIITENGITANTTINLLEIATDDIISVYTGNSVSTVGGEYPAESNGLIETIGTVLNSTNSNEITVGEPSVVLTLEHDVPANTDIIISIAREDAAGEVNISNGTTTTSFNAGPNSISQHLVFNSTVSTTYLSFNRILGSTWIDGVEYSYSVTYSGCAKTLINNTTVTVEDNQDPIITCPADITTTTNGACSASGVALGSPTTSDNCSVASTTNNAPANFPPGETIVTWTVTDAAGNTATCDQRVYIESIDPYVSLIYGTATSPISYTENVVYSDAAGVRSTYAIDVNSDGFMDFVSSSFDDNKIAWFENDGNGNFTTHIISTTTGEATDVFAIDIDNDNDIDILSSQKTNGRFKWFENDGNENFTEHIIDSSDINNPKSITASDINGDNEIDVLVAIHQTGQVVWYENDGNETFTKHIIDANITKARDAVASDVDSDGDIDIVAAAKGDAEILWYENDGSESFTKHVISDGLDKPTSVFAIDIDNDGDIDVLSAIVKDNEIAWFENDGSESFTKHSISTSAIRAWNVSAADMDNDGDIDVLSASQEDNKLAWYENDGSESFTPHVVSTNQGDITTVFPIDVDNDGDLDILNASNSDDEIGWFESDLLTQTCQGEDVVFTETGGDALTWSWSSNGAATFNDNSLQSPTVSGAVDGEIFTVSITNASGCSNSKSIYFATAPDAPDNTFSVSDSEICLGSSATINLSDSELGVSYQLRLDSDNSNVGSAVVGTGNPISISVSPVVNTTYNVYASGGGFACDIELTDKAIITIDTQDPLITCSANQTQNVDAGNCTAVVTVVAPTTSDNCTVASVINNFNGTANASGTYPIGITSVLWTVTDNNGNTATCTQTITVNDNEAPAIAGSITTTNIEACNIGSAPAAQTTVAGLEGLTGNLTITDCSLDANITVSNSDVSVGTCPIVLTRTYTLTDEAGNSNTTTHIINIDDNTAPTASNPANISVQCIGDVPVAAVSVLTDESDNCTSNPVVAHVSDISDGNSCPETITRTYSVTDDCGNSANVTQLILINDTQVPIITGTLTTTTVEGCDNSSAPVAETTVAGIESLTGSATISDNCTADGSLLVTHIDSQGGTNPIVITRTYTITDACSNFNTIVQTINIEDITDPIITCPSNQTANIDAGQCDAAMTIPVATFTDNCAGGSITNNYNAGGANASGTYPVGVTTVVFTATDAVGNTDQCSITVTISDNENPIALCQDITVNLDGTGNASITGNDIDNGSTDNCAITSYSVLPNAFTSANLGDNNVVLTITDAAGNSSTCAAIVTVTDLTPPEAICQNIIIQLDANGNATIIGTDIDGGSTDNGVIVSYVANPSTFNCTTTGDNNVTLTVTDDAGLTDDCIAIVTVQDNINPTALCQDITIQLDNTGKAIITAADIDNGSNDNCTFTLSASQTAFDCTHVGTNTVTLTITDATGNTATCNATVTVEDNVNPTITCAAEQTQTADASNCSAAVTVLAPATADNCGVASISNDYNNTADASDTYPVGTTTITWTVTDDNNNTNTCTQKITVRDNENPSITCAADQTQTADAGSCNAVITVLSPATADNCGVQSVVNDFNNTADASGTYSVGITTITWTVTDIHGNTNTCTQDITVEDDENPTITCAANQTQTADAGVCEAIVNVTAPAAADNCGVQSVLNDFNGTDDASGTYPTGNNYHYLDSHRYP